MAAGPVDTPENSSSAWTMLQTKQAKMSPCGGSEGVNHDLSDHGFVAWGWVTVRADIGR